MIIFAGWIVAAFVIWLTWLFAKVVRTVRKAMEMNRIAAANGLKRRDGESTKELARRVYHKSPCAVSVFDF